MKQFKAGHWIKQKDYKSFQPELINRQWLIDDMEVQKLLSQADRQIGRLDMFSEHAPNVDMFISMHVLKEATQSSKIEGTQTNIEDALLSREDVDIEKRDDWEEVNNYILAMTHAIESLENVPFSTRLIKQTHETLLQGVRGKHKLPGEFRRSQNWIGGATLNDATFVPPVSSSISELMGDLENFVHSDAHYLPDLLKVAIMHYQFETIHPFLDGNGRVGRLLITLYLVEKGILKQPVLYLSDFFERYRDLYYDNLMRVRIHDDIKQWFKFFLTGVIETAKKGVDTFDRILLLKARIENEVNEKSKRSGQIMKVLDSLYKKPLINAQTIGDLVNVSMVTAYKIVEEMEQRGILKEITGEKRGKIYLFIEYIRLFKGK
ncbi:Fic family protein [Marinicella gelatinilytica]|jgi:Fic family protein|uniref:Fic family protein n=1 Tax=Marinicella gelatinilytica TaxID=2996017 RepID=UPI002260948A|nr:Fic family protein [Marinicella gelatinilytica]MCX7546222.1 Fic family protein [Marinicella gelatinilytica]